ncbi:MAG: hypothetical protein IMW89_07990 [Ktedonobacteraceae bacterium]|nr:hypothetical protein [Ktedonobacteraceae bacterium]
MHTPWGVSHTQTQLEEGVFWVQTPENGGILIEYPRAGAYLSEKAMKIGKRWHDFLVFEQESDMTVVWYEHPEWYMWAEADLVEKLAEDMLRQSHPEYFSAEIT